MRHLSTAELVFGLDGIRAAPAETGTLVMIVRRPAEMEREVVDHAELSVELGLVGDNWLVRGSRQTADRSADPERQLTLMSARAIDLFAAGERERWALAGDQLYVDLDLSEANAPAGTRFAIGTAVVEVTAAPHNGCTKFVQRFGRDASRLVNSPEGKAMHLRGVNAAVIQHGVIAVGDPVAKL